LLCLKGFLNFKAAFQNIIWKKSQVYKKLKRKKRINSWFMQRKAKSKSALTIATRWTS